MKRSSITQLLLLITALLFVTVSLPGCTQAVRYVAEPLPLPARPVLPSITAAELMCLSDETYKRLVTRERLRREYAEELEAIIRATQTTKPP